MKNISFNFSGGVIPLVVLGILAMLMIPFSPLMLDIMFSINIALTLTVLMVVVNTKRPLDFSIFPRVLLAATIFRLGLNVASTRVILLNGHTGTSGAGQVIDAFGKFVVGGNFAVGIIVFAILTLISLMVITKGAERISEVKARFSLDSMPGSQMAVDADLNSGSISQDEAASRRSEIAMESQFFGSMDGTSKFVKGDAYVSILILAINIVGGFVVGMAQHGLPVADAIRNYTLLSIGDGLVAQIPSLLMATATAIMISGVTGKEDSQGVDEIFRVKAPVYCVSGVLLFVGFIPGIPFFVFALSSAALALLTYWYKPSLVDGESLANETTVTSDSKAYEPSYTIDKSEVKTPKVIELKLGMRILDLVAEGSGFMAQVYSVRRELSKEMGFVVKGVHVNEDSSIHPNEYNILINGIPVADGAVWTSLSFAMNLDNKPGIAPLKGKEAYDPVYGAKGYWIRESDIAKARDRGYEVTDSDTIIATHLRKVLIDNAAKLIKTDDVVDCIDRVKSFSPSLAEAVSSKVDNIVLLKVFRQLLLEKVSIKQIEVIFETLAEHSGHNLGPRHLAELCRKSLKEYIMEDLKDKDGKVTLMMLSERLQLELTGSLNKGELAPSSSLMKDVLRSLKNGISQMEEAGNPLVLLVPSNLRPGMADIFGATLPQLSIICPNELTGNEVATTVEI